MRANRFVGKTVLITGGAGGLGAAIAAAIAAEGGKVGILDTDQVAIESLLAKLRLSGGQGVGRTVDVRDGIAVTAAVDFLAESLGGIDVLIAAAGGSLGTPRDLEDITDADLDLVIDVNVKGTYYCARATIPHLKKTWRWINRYFLIHWRTEREPRYWSSLCCRKGGNLGAD